MLVKPETLSLLSAMKKFNNHNKNIMVKNFKKIQKTITTKMNPFIVENIDKTYTAQRMYVNKSLVAYTKDADLLNSLSEMTSEKLLEFMKNKDNSIINYDSFSDDSDTKKFVALKYSGGKSNHKTTQQSLVTSILLSNPQIDTYYEMFVGGFGSVYNSLPVLLKHGITNIFLSDINKSLINMYRQIQKNPYQVQRHLSSIDLEHFEFFGKNYPETKEEGKEWFDYIYAEFSKLEEKNRMNPKRAAYFMYLVSNTQGSMLNYDMKKKVNKLVFSFDKGKVKTIPLLINKVEIFHKIFNVANIKFSIKRYETVHNQIKNKTNVLVLHDSPYAEFTDIKKKIMENCSYNYGIDDFKQEPLLTKIKNAKYPVIYYNNHNPVIEEFSLQNNFNYHKMDVVYTNGKENTKSVEILMFSDRQTVSQEAFNRVDFKSNQIKKTA